MEKQILEEFEKEIKRTRIPTEEGETRTERT